MAIDLNNPLSVRTNVRTAIQTVLNEVLESHSVNFADISNHAISAVWKPTGINRRYFLSFLGRIGDHINRKLPGNVTLKIRSDMFKASMTFRDMLDKLSNLVGKLAT